MFLGSLPNLITGENEKLGLLSAISLRVLLRTLVTPTALIGPESAAAKRIVKII